MLRVLILSLTFFIANSQANSKLYKRHARYARQEQKDSSSTKDKLNLNELRLLEKYDNILTAIDHDKDVHTAERKRDVVERTRIDGELNTATKRREIIGFRKSKDLKNNADGIVRKKTYKRSKDRSSKTDGGIEENAVYHDFARRSRDDLTSELYKEVKDWSGRDSNLKLNDNQLNQDYAVLVDDVETNKADNLGENEENEREVERGDSASKDDDVIKLPKDVENILAKKNYEIKNWSDEGDELVTNVMNGNKNENEADDIRIMLDGNKNENEADDIRVMLDGNKNENEADDIRVMLDGVEEKPRWDKRNRVLESVEETLGYKAEEGDEGNSEVVEIQVEDDYSPAKHVVETYPKKQLKTGKNKGIIYRPWIKQQQSKGKRNKNIKDTRFVDNTIIYWIPQLEEDETSEEKTKKERVKELSGLLLRGKEVKRVQGVQGDTHLSHEKQIDNLGDTKLSWGRQYRRMAEKTDSSWKRGYDNMVERGFNDVKIKRRKLKKRHESEKYVRKDNNDNRMKDEHKYDADGSNISKRNLFANENVKDKNVGRKM